MDEDEVLQQEMQDRYETIEDLAYARKKRRCLNSKIKRVLLVIDEGKRILESKVTDTENGNKKDNDDISLEDWPSYNDLAALINDVTETDSNISKGNDELRKWGIRD